METDKVAAYIGFAVKSGNLCAGVNAISTLKNRVFLLIVCSSASENTKKDAAKLAAKFRCNLVEYTAGKLEDVLRKENCKLVAIRDKGLADAVENNLHGDFTIYSGGRKG